MSFRLTNQKYPQHTFSLNNQTWYALLDLAQEYGWYPVGTVVPEWVTANRQAFAYDFGLVLPYEGSYTSVEGGRLVVLEDALNLSDALERAFLAYEPERVLRYSDFLFDNGWNGRHRQTRPSLGAIVEMIDFCQNGAFWIERL